MVHLLTKAYFIVLILKVLSQPFKICDNLTFSRGIVDDFNVTAFSDQNRYLRLNISWGEPEGDFEYVDIIINNKNNVNNDAACSLVYGAENYLINRHFLIKPTMDIVHPADLLMHGCVYEFTLRSRAYISNESCTVSQSLTYKVPDCVGNVCKCGEQTDSPYKLSTINLLSDNHMYEITCNSTEEYTSHLELEHAFHEMLYESTSTNSSVTYLNYDQIVFNNDDLKMMVPLHDLRNGLSYTIVAKFVLDNCLYFSSIDLTMPAEESGVYFVFAISFVIIVPLTIIIFYVKKNTKLLQKIRRYLRIPSLNVPVVTYTSNVEYPLSVIKEEMNAQYTPLEFVLQSHKFDKYEFPRNKIVFKRELGSGAFGKVSEAKVYEIAGQANYSIAAVKQLLDNAPDEESQDFLAEIDLLKKIDSAGGHANVIKILGCVTMDRPYLIIMDLAPCGSLYKYLRNLRQEWEKQKKAWKDEAEAKKKNNTRRFFPDDMEESWLQPESYQIKEENGNQLKYSSLEFEDSDDKWVPHNPSESGSGSYVSPDSPSLVTPTTPKTPKTPTPYVTTPRSPTSRSFHEFVRKFPIGRARRLNSTSSNASNGGVSSVASATSSRLPSITETLMTNLTDAETPLLDEDIPSVQPALSHIELQQFAFQIASGMAYLESISVTHRDLAARNVLIAKGKVLKISDFGLARTGNYVTKKNRKMPLRWMAPEAIQRSRCDNKSDVWSFAVVLWEIGSLGAFPYYNTDNSLILHNLKKGIRLEPPKVCTEELYSIMERCWSLNPDDRPDFKDLVKTLDVANKQKVYVDFNQLPPTYVFPTSQQTVKDDED